MSRKEMDRVNKILKKYREFKYPLGMDGDVRFLLSLLGKKDPSLCDWKFENCEYPIEGC